MKFRDFIGKYSFLIVVLIVGYLIWDEIKEKKGIANHNGAQQRNMKGFELYVWSNQEKTLYTLLPGTNRNKDSAEIYNPKVAVEWPMIKQRLDNIADSQYVLVRPLGIDSIAMEDLRRYLKTRALIVQ